MAKASSGLLLTALSFLVVAAAAAQPPKADSPPGQPPAVVKLSLNQDVDVENGGTRLKLRMTGVKDSRCPKDVMCIVAGNATVTVNVTPLAPGQSDKAATVTLMLPGQPQSAAGATFTLEAVDPYPMASQPNPSPPVATVRVAKS
jgi:hypothetical protein